MSDLADRFLPLTPLTASILLAVAGGARHGYAILKELEERRGAVRVPGAGSLYAALQRMVDEGLLEEAPDLAEESEGPRRRCYALTELGRRVGRLEMARLAELVALAAERRLAPAPASRSSRRGNG
ncbi:MAG: PadR family transcriptional regulator [Gemmatimonadetes bacterium]|nr:PadR family transcriptional regulator [Gemmatimonadota bacterium]